MTEEFLKSLHHIVPQIILFIGSLTVMMLGLWKSSKVFITSLATLFFVLAIGAQCYVSEMNPGFLFKNILVDDNFGRFFTYFVIIVMMMSVWVSHLSQSIKGKTYSDYISMLLALTTGLSFMAISNHLLMIYLSIETVSILSYCLAGIKKDHSKSNESALKYVVYGSMASGLMVYGMSLLYGMTGALDLNSIGTFLGSAQEGAPTLFWIGVLLTFVGFGYKIAIAPMHMWTPDVYEGAPTPVATMFSVAPKAAGFALLIRACVVALAKGETEGGLLTMGYAHLNTELALFGSQILWPEFLMYISMLTMFMGNLAALLQKSVKRMLAYSAIAHAGYILMGLCTGDLKSISAILFYLIVYAVMNFGAFWVTIKVEEAKGDESLNSFKGLIFQKPIYAICMTIFLCSLIGLPPFAGFMGKYQLFIAVLSKKMYLFALVAGINSVISLYYYIKVVRVMFMDQPEVEVLKGQEKAFNCPVSKFAVVLLAIPNILWGIGIYLDEVVLMSKKMVSFFVGI